MWSVNLDVKDKVLFIFSFQNPATCFMTYDIYVGIVIHVLLYHIFLDKFENFKLWDTITVSE